MGIRKALSPAPLVTSAVRPRVASPKGVRAQHLDVPATQAKHSTDLQVS